MDLNSKGPSNLLQSYVNFAMKHTSFTSNHCTKQFLFSYMFQLRTVAIVKEPQHHKDISSIFCKGKGKGTAISLQAWTGLKGFRRLRLPDFKTFGT
jgi:hypothetical protein